MINLIVMIFRFLGKRIGTFIATMLIAAKWYETVIINDVFLHKGFQKDLLLNKMMIYSSYSLLLALTVSSVYITLLAVFNRKFFGEVVAYVSAAAVSAYPAYKYGNWTLNAKTKIVENSTLTKFTASTIGSLSYSLLMALSAVLLLSVVAYQNRLLKPAISKGLSFLITNAVFFFRKTFNTYKVPAAFSLDAINNFPESQRGKAFEFFVANLAKVTFGKAVTTEQLKYEGSLKKGPGDQGVDVVAWNNKGEKIIIQCKYYAGTVSNKAVQEIVAAKSLYKADKMIVVTTSSFTVFAEELAKANGVELWDGEFLSGKIKEASKKLAA